MKKWLLLFYGSILYTTVAFTQTTLVKNFPNNGSPSVFETLNNLIIFSTADGLWRSDGTTTGTTLLTANASFSKLSYRRCLVGNLVYFWGPLDDQSRTTLWKTDGTVAGTSLVKTFADGHDFGPLVNVNGLLVFGFTTSAAGTELWRSDGTDGGTVMVTDLVPGTGNGILYDSPQLSVLDGYFYFQGPVHWDGTCNGPCNNDGSNYNYRPVLYRTDGTANGTSMVSNGGFGPYHMTVLGGKLIYQADIPYTANYPNCSAQPITDFATVLMKIEGGTASVLTYPVNITKCDKSAQLGSTFTNTAKFVKSSNYLYFQGITTVNSQAGSIMNLWRTDGTTAGTIQLTNFAEGSSEGPFGAMFTRNTVSNFGYTDIAYFPIFTNSAGAELWRSDGTMGGTFLLKDIYPGATGSGTSTNGNPNNTSGPLDFRTVNGITYFYASEGTNGMELWKTDGSAAGTQLVQNLNPGAASQPVVENGNWYDNYNGISVGNTYFFGGNNGAQRGLYTVLPTAMYTIKTGSWNDPATWSGNRLPMSTDTLTLNHAVTIPGSYIGQALRIIYSATGRLLFSATGKLKLAGN